MKALIQLLREAAEIIAEDDTNPNPPGLEGHLGSAADKISDNPRSPNLTKSERDAVEFALRDLGDLYVNSGTTAGFDTEDPKEAESDRIFGRLAHQEAGALGIHIDPNNGQSHADGGGII